MICNRLSVAFVFVHCTRCVVFPTPQLCFRCVQIGLTQIKLHNAIIMIISKRRFFRLIYKYKRYITCEIYIRVGGRGTALLTCISVSVHAIAYANDYDSSSINTKLLLCSLR